MCTQKFGKEFYDEIARNIAVHQVAQVAEDGLYVYHNDSENARIHYLNWAAVYERLCENEAVFLQFKKKCFDFLFSPNNLEDFQTVTYSTCDKMLSAKESVQ